MLELSAINNQKIEFLNQVLLINQSKGINVLKF